MDEVKVTLSTLISKRMQPLRIWTSLKKVICMSEQTRLTKPHEESEDSDDSVFCP